MRQKVFRRSVRFAVWTLAALLMVVGSACMAMAASSSSAQKGNEGPKLVVVESTFNAGKVIEGEDIVHTFILKNKGTKDLIIKDVKPG